MPIQCASAYLSIHKKEKNENKYLHFYLAALIDLLDLSKLDVEAGAGPVDRPPRTLATAARRHLPFT